MESHDVCFWANTGHIDVELADGTPQSFFIKVESQDVGKAMLSSEFEFTKAKYRLARDDLRCLLSHKQFRRPSLRIASERQVSKWQVGFHITNQTGNLPQYTAWEDSWVTLVARA
ncbi:hypothetical protein BDV96DRAFT_608447 [Lophiotrema nucula]|uniref:Uncharacterized protein n=1 Tax=Lophiotrema nucula TaxID=690887 RepID=A0A6A5YDS0_9PLEO|nr:hypothetical protein BDV96DRAFT_608447 [Lophiotrema nucula]